ncbi:MAG: hypothetical protein K8R85_06145 [Bacteroidetes bacterium]|nr:hypothetical protein [Bacteroidota bacterium]
MENTEDLQKYFDSKEYSTSIIGKEGEEEPVTIDESKISNLISLLTDPANKELKEGTLLTLKKEKGGNLLLLAIASPKAENVRHKLVAACWESEINYSHYFSFFILLALDNDYLVSLEAITVISTMEGPFNNDDVRKAIKKVKAAKETITTEKVVLLNDLVDTLEGFIAPDNNEFEKN